MKEKEFALLVKNMREAQKRYFKSRSATAMHESKLWEGKVDYALTQMDLPKTDGEQIKLLLG